MGCGKTTSGRIAAEKLCCEFVDMDDYIVQKLGMSIPVIFAEKGERYFRENETEAVRALADRKCIIACGGGAMLNRENADIARENGAVIYIEADFESCYARISGKKGRPIVTGSTKDELNLIYDSRVPLYKANSDIVIDGSGSAEENADRIILAIN